MQQRVNIPIIIFIAALSVVLFYMNLNIAAAFALGCALIVLAVTYIEKKHLEPIQLLPIVVLSVTASIGRVVFNFIPQIQPVTAIVIIAGAALGKRAGTLTGILCALISNMFLGHGPWTIWQIISWGLIGCIAGFFGNSKPVWIYVFGFLAGFIHGLITDFWTILYYGENLNFNIVLTVYGAGMLFNLIHAIGNIFFLLLFYKPFGRKLKRIKDKTENAVKG